MRKQPGSMLIVVLSLMLLGLQVAFAAAPADKAAPPKPQTTCPVLGNPIDKNIFIEYQGKKVYFCCKGCPDVFKADPAKYIASGYVWYIGSQSGSWTGAYLGTDGTPLWGCDFDGDGKTDPAKYVSAAGSIWRRR